jgi:F-type H+-transporting ATPase subunit gamma
VVSLATQYIESRKLEAELITIGKMGRTMMLREGYQIHAEFSNLSEKVDITDLTPVARVLLDGFRDRIFDEVVICYTEFQSGTKLKPTIRQLLPICPGEAPSRREYIYEPDPAELLQALLPRLIRFQIFQAFLESLAAENTSRMVAMHAATQSASDIIDHLTISYNKARQQAITAEINDILGGASALGKD